MVNAQAGGVVSTVEYPPPSAPYAVAQQLYQEHLSNEGLSHLAAWRGGWMAWQQTRWVEVDAAALRQSIYAALSQAKYWYETTKIAEWRPWNPDKHKMVNVLESLAAVVHLSSDIDPPAWINDVSGTQTGPMPMIETASSGDVTQTPAAQMVSCRNGLLDLSTRRLHDHTPALFNLVSVPFDYEADAVEPAEWLKFLVSIWDDDEDSIALLQEYFGYVLSGRLEQQKLLALIGATRSGKGTIARTLTELVGAKNVANPTMASLSTNFGLMPLIGKPLAIVSDARLGSAPADAVVERLLSITGEDCLTIDRKYQAHWTGKLASRFLLLSNELPKFKDASGVIANRFLVLRMTKSWLHNEDLELASKLRLELPAILNWSLQGLDRLNDRGRFTVPASARDAVIQMQDMASPVSAFVRERCVREPDASIPRDSLYAAWRDWAETNGHRAMAKTTFGRDLRAVVPEIKSAHLGPAGSRVHHHTGIRLRTSSDNDKIPVHPVHGKQSAGQGASTASMHPVHESVHSSRAQDEHVHENEQNCRSGTRAQDAQAETHCGSNTEAVDPPEDGGLFAESPSDNGEVRYCGCGNALLTLDALNSGKCRPCRQRQEAHP